MKGEKESDLVMTIKWIEKKIKSNQRKERSENMKEIIDF